MKSIEQKRTEALARREKDLEFWERVAKATTCEDLPHVLAKIVGAKRDITNLKRKLSLS